MESVLRIPIKKEYKNILKPFGDFKVMVNNALRRYILDIVSERIEKCETEINKLELKYDCSYEVFLSKVGTNENTSFLQKLEEENPTWEADFNRWEAYTEELNRWKKHMNAILKV